MIQRNQWDAPVCLNTADHGRSAVFRHTQMHRPMSRWHEANDKLSAVINTDEDCTNSWCVKAQIPLTSILANLSYSMLHNGFATNRSKSKTNCATRFHKSGKLTTHLLQHFHFDMSRYVVQLLRRIVQHVQQVYEKLKQWSLGLLAQSVTEFGDKLAHGWWSEPTIDLSVLHV